MKWKSGNVTFKKSLSFSSLLKLGPPSSFLLTSTTHLIKASASAGRDSIKREKSVWTLSRFSPFKRFGKSSTQYFAILFQFSSLQLCRKLKLLRKENYIKCFIPTQLTGHWYFTTVYNDEGAAVFLDISMNLTDNKDIDVLKCKVYKWLVWSYERKLKHHCKFSECIAKQGFYTH